VLYQLSYTRKRPKTFDCNDLQSIVKWRYFRKAVQIWVLPPSDANPIGFTTTTLLTSCSKNPTKTLYSSPEPDSRPRKLARMNTNERPHLSAWLRPAEIRCRIQGTTWVALCSHSRCKPDLQSTSLGMLTSGFLPPTVGTSRPLANCILINSIA